MMTPQMREKHIKNLENFRNLNIVLLLGLFILEYHTKGAITYSTSKLLMFIGILGFSIPIRRIQKQKPPLVKRKYRLLALIVSHLIVITIFSPLVLEDMRFSNWIVFSAVLLVVLVYWYVKTIAMEKEMESKGMIEESKE